jgi:hypothetical protein
MVIEKKKKKKKKKNFFTKEANNGLKNMLWIWKSNVTSSGVDNIREYFCFCYCMVQ